MSNKPIRIALGGKQGTGKSTAAEYLINNYDFKKTGFADKIKKVAMDLFGATYDEVYVSKNKRPLLQKIGFQMREIDNDVWTKYVTNQLKDNNQNIVIDDLRMISEFNALKEAEFIIIKLECDKEMCKSRIKSFANENDPTEIEMDALKDWDYVIKNEKDREYLFEQLDLIVKNHSNK